jgi:uncharacterized damage-inducible protein DinB
MLPACLSSTRRNFLAGSASFSALAGATTILGEHGQARSTAMHPQSSSGHRAVTPVPPKHRPDLPKMVPPYDKGTINLIGPRSGYSPQVGTIVTMLTWMELAVLGPTRELKQEDLDFLLDKNANSIGALMLHLAATEVLYQRMTFNNENFDKFPADYDAKWGAAMNLGDAGRSSIKGHDIAFYQETIRDVREKTLSEFAKRDDAWLLTPLKKPGWGGGPINQYCLWFHVCEHISHHAGQIGFLIKRLPGAKPDAAVG